MAAVVVLLGNDRSVEVESRRASGRRKNKIYLIVMPHWRGAVSDVVNTLRECEVEQGAGRIRLAKRISAGGRLLASSSATVALCSDADNSKLLSLLSRRGSFSSVRLWWNGAEEVARWLKMRDGADQAREVNITFFRDVATKFKGPKSRVLHIPFAFSRPNYSPCEKLDSRICFTSEVDISDACFGAMGARNTGSDIAWECAGKIVGGEKTLSELPSLLGATGISHADADADVMRWAVRNRVRFLLIEQLQKAFPGKIVLRGSDWSRLGLSALPTVFKRDVLLNDYRTYRVSLDLGSKSTSAMLYPRSADIMSCAGGLAQFDSGENVPNDCEAWSRRRAGTADALLGVVDAMLGARETELQENNRALHQSYCRQRRESALALMTVIVQSAKSAGSEI